MIAEEVKRYCNGDISQIENYDKAINDNTQTWHCHHRAEILPCGNFSVETLKKYSLYWNRNPEELIFITKSEHMRLHTKGDKNPLFGKQFSYEHRRKISESAKGHKRRLGMHHSEETKRKISEATKGRTPPNKGKPMSDKTKRKLSEANKGKKSPYKGRHHSEESRLKISLARKAYYAKKKMIGK